MTTKTLYSVVFTALTVSLVSLACSKNEKVPDPENVYGFASRQGAAQTTFWGPALQMGNGHIRSFVILEKQDNKPVQVGFELTAGALENLPPATPTHADHNGPHYMVKLHPVAQSATVFDHLVVDWNADGHGPPPYLAPHFDFHMYMIPNSQRLQITADDPKSVAALPAGYLPDDYIGPVGPEPQMGGHCVDITSPELLPPGSPGAALFTHTFIYGAYDSKVAFYEPMITLDYLRNVTSESFDIKQPLYFNKPGYYPTKYLVYKEGGRTYVVLSGFVLRN